ncbi:hypothetical protein CAEBREN_01651 [Caenorhabditis brenneri]|uniref:Uncharacterized protein n=1 Tax=Caenorhabditis brenneri TaxID=135651 RepID=G0NE69_CAEBE|nr:hypothetical protein CAEBREN_01651 [Caenorhabditis brenneri]
MNQDFGDLEKNVYTLTDPNESRHDCVYVVDEHYLVTYQSDDHSMLEVGQKLVVYNLLDKNIKVEVSVYDKCEILDIIVLETTHKFDFERGNTRHHTVNRLYHQLGINQENRTPLWTQGTLTERFNGRYLGSTTGMLGDVIFDEFNKFIGIVVAKRGEEDKIFILKHTLVDSNVPKGLTHDVRFENVRLNRFIFFISG